MSVHKYQLQSAQEHKSTRQNEQYLKIFENESQKGK
jgi:hypothetical protein